MNLEDFLIRMGGEITIVGGSPLYTDSSPPDAISINGFRPECKYAAVNITVRDHMRCLANKQRMLMPHFWRKGLENYDYALTPNDTYELPEYLNGGKIQPTTCFALLVICRQLLLRVQLFGVCGWASKWHDGDWEMHYVKRFMPNVTVHDPRPPW